MGELGVMPHTVRKLLLQEMVGSVSGEWKVLIMDEFSVRVMSAACRMSDILEEGVSLVEDLNKKRQPMPHMPGIYFITPSVKSVMTLCEDFKHGAQYQSAHVFFTSKVSTTEITEIKKHPHLVARLKTLKEVGCEFLTVDSRTFTTDQPNALIDLFGDGTAGTIDHENAINIAASRLATVFTSLGEFPAIRYRMGKPASDGDPPGAEARSLVAQRVAAKLHSQLVELQRSGQLPQHETCDLVVVDRSVDPVAPIIHEWTYEAMAYDLLDLTGNSYKYEAENTKGDKETKEGYLEEHDPLWVDLRHLFIADASLKLNNLLTDFRSQNKAAKVAGGSGLNRDAGNLKGVVQSLSTYNQELSKLSLHIDIASSLNTKIREMKLDEVGKLEQDLVFGDVTSKEVIELLSKRKRDLEWLDKVRILMSYVTTHPEKLDSEKIRSWQKLTDLQEEHMHMISNLEYLGQAVFKRGPKSGALSFGMKKKRQTRKLRNAGDNQEQWDLSRFQPVISEIQEDMAKDALPEAEYPYINKPAKGSRHQTSAGSARTKQSSVGWARRAAQSAVDPAGVKLQTKRMVIFVLGGVTRSEMRTCYTMSKTLQRDILLGSTSVEVPQTYIKKVYSLSPLEGEVSFN
mmetsp:Transcript_8642/g.24836  ORF Transcript_8642/g.24836 Transcript_8642/m.24836 type:complete len:628 (-) Transcript_8642:138-2021(-)|eukprot:CAMPEP_0117657092 /NCGR_PEP_ID=MMETSP0804-20121206/5149_1 /TAXON_ID=1074897 /ORGANISM="Tetraselmis astigmatica, Strain CCMP880" /LENGTH=627 /DNA_ID=CAMNT_0005463529 /DNA_START=478 /DNA_END=2361 /DNA_ORIENTATION=-